MTDAELTAAALAAAGLSVDSAEDRRRFASITGRTERTVRNWLGGATVPTDARDWLVRWCALPARTRARVLAALAA